MDAIVHSLTVWVLICTVLICTIALALVFFAVGQGRLNSKIAKKLDRIEYEFRRCEQTTEAHLEA